MKKKINYKESRGLPGGPNEQFTYVTGVFSTEGYKRNSPDVNNPFNIIPSGNITMKGVDFPVMGTDNLGNTQMMMPGNDYQFPGDQVLEIPVAQKGKEYNDATYAKARQEGRLYGLDPTTGDYYAPTLREAMIRPDIANRIYQGQNKFLSGALDVMSAPQKSMVELMTGKYQSPSEAMKIKNPIASFLIDAVVDPTNLLGAGLLKPGVFNNMYKNALRLSNKTDDLIYKDIYKHPKLAIGLNKGVRINSLDNVTTNPGLKFGDVQSYDDYITTSKQKPGAISESTFFKGLGKGRASLNSSLEKRIQDLKSTEGFNRLVNQEREWLIAKGQDPSVADRVAKLNAKARINELENIGNINADAFKYSQENILGGVDNQFVNDNRLYNNAYYSRGYNTTVEDKIEDFIKNDYSTPKRGGGIGIGYNYINNKPIEMHEIAHALQRSRKLPIDHELLRIVPKEKLKGQNWGAYDYFKTGSKGKEPSALANELREAMFQKGFIPDYYSPITQQQVENAYKYFKRNPMGSYDPKTGHFLSNTRIFDFMAPTKENSKILTDVLNKLPAVIPAMGAGYLGYEGLQGALQEKQYGGDNKGTRKLMRPGKNYQFPGDMVFEIPMAQVGQEVMINEGDGVRNIISTNSPQYRRAYKEGRLGVKYDDFIDMGEMREAVVTPYSPNLARDIMGVFDSGIKTAGELTGLAGTARFINDPVENLKNAGNFLGKTLVKGSPYAGSSPYGNINLNTQVQYTPEEIESFFNTLDAAGLATIVGAGLKVPLQQGLKQTGKYLTQGPLRNAYNLRSSVLKENPEMFLYRARPVGQDINMNMAAQIRAKQAAGEPLTWYQKNLLNPQTNPQLLAREKYYGQWFEKDPNRLDWYIDPGTRNFADQDAIEILRTRLPKSEAAKLNVSQFDDAKMLSSSPETEFILPKDMVNTAERFPESSLQQLIAEDKAFNTPHWWRGYGSKTPKQLPGSPNTFKSEINWAKWNKEIPKNKPLLQEYNAIEQQTKADGTWMKNPDGSEFKGTPEQFVQQNSQNFKKAFPNVIRDEAGNVQKTYHGSQNTFDYFDPNIMMTGRTRGQGIYTSPFRERAASYATKGDKKVYEFYQNASNPQLKLEEFNKASDKRFQDFLKKHPKGSKDFDKKFYEFMNNEDKFFDKLTDEEYFKLQPGYDFYKAASDEYVVPFTNYPKSAIGNNGMFDMTNPNIYKALFPGAIATGLLSQEYQTGGEYKVKAGDTFYGIANRNNISWEDLKKANPDINIENLKINQVIKLPRLNTPKIEIPSWASLENISPVSFQDNTFAVKPFVNNVPMFQTETKPEEKPEEKQEPSRYEKLKEQYLKDLKIQENSVKKGWNEEKQLWFPYKAVEKDGGYDIGFGHKILRGEDFSKGLTQEEVIALMLKDYKNKRKSAESFYNRKGFDRKWEDLDPTEQILLTDYQYNAGLNKFPKFLKAVANKDKNTMLKEYIRYSDGKPLVERNKWTKSFIENTLNYQKGGDVPLIKAQEGKGFVPIYVDNLNDPRIRSYQDSLNLYKAMVMQDKLMGPNYDNENTNRRFAPSTSFWTQSELKKARTPKWNASLEMNIAKDFPNEKDMFAKPGPWGRPEDKKLLDYYRSLGFGDDNIMFHSSPDIVHPTIKAVGSYHDGTAWSPVYKKPKQPVKYRNPEIAAKQQLIDAGYDIGGADGIWGKKSQAAPIYVDNPNDPRLKAYKDSLALYNSPYSEKLKNVNPNNVDYEKGEFFNSEFGKDNIKPIAITKSDARPIYKKPVQPYVYRNPEIIAKQQELIKAGYDIGGADGIWGPKSQAAWDEYTKQKEVKQPQIVENKPPIQTIIPRQKPQREYDNSNKPFVFLLGNAAYATYDDATAKDFARDLGIENPQRGNNKNIDPNTGLYREYNKATPNKYSQKLKPLENGGELNVYEDYINGMYDGTSKEAQAQKIYDKLNRVYYRNAKELGMTPPNYIMSKVIRS